MPRQRIPLVAVRLQCWQSTFSASLWVVLLLGAASLLLVRGGNGAVGFCVAITIGYLGAGLTLQLEDHGAQRDGLV